MTAKNLRIVLILFTALLIASCGTVATPVWEAPQEPEAHDEPVSESDTEGEAIAVEPTTPPTNTPEPPTPTPTPTTVPPTATPTEEPEAAPDDPIVRQVQFSDPERGRELFNEQHELSTGVWACATCHSIEPGVDGVGPSQWGLPDRAGDRVEGQVAERYIYNSIMHPEEYIVEGYEDGTQMPADYGQESGPFSETDILNIVAYLMTLSDE